MATTQECHCANSWVINYTHHAVSRCSGWNGFIPFVHQLRREDEGGIMCICVCYDNTVV